MISARLRAMRGLHWQLLFGAILLSWLALYILSVPAELRAAGLTYGADALANFCRVTPDAGGVLRLSLMWALMSAAMMAPTALPAFATYDDLRQGGADTDFAKLVAGYLTVWLGFSVLAAVLQILLYEAALLSPFGQSRSAWLTAGLLALAGAYQFSTLKDSCLSKCRQPLTFFMQHWDEGPWRNGLRLGLTCLGCCWALMLLGFVGGVMSLAFMGLATLLMIFEKLPDLGRYLTRPLGAGLLAAAVITVFTA